MELLAIGSFCGVLLGSVVLGFGLIAPLLVGLAIFAAYGLARGHSPRALAKMAAAGFMSGRRVIVNIVMVGMLTALWRASGTIPSIISMASGAITPSFFLLTAFIFNAFVSILMGTAFGTSATMGVICASIGNTIGVDPIWSGGAIISGVFVGDRMSPVSTSALLVSSLAETDIYTDLKKMAASSIVPIAATCAIYLFVGRSISAIGSSPDVRSIFEREFVIGVPCLVPAIVVLALAALRVKVRDAMAASIISAGVVAVVVQGSSIESVAKMAVFGYFSSDAELAPMIDGGGLVSMARVISILVITSCCSGLFRGTGVLAGVEGAVRSLASKIGVRGTVGVVSCAASAVGCNQTLAIMLTDQLCGDLYTDRYERAIDLEDTVVVIAPLIPWSIAGSVPVISIGAPMACLLASCYLYLLPLWRIFGPKKNFFSFKER